LCGSYTAAYGSFGPYVSYVWYWELLTPTRSRVQRDPEPSGVSVTLQSDVATGGDDRSGQ
jgi:hypothetical protein